MRLVKIKRVGEPVWHYALESDVRPVCGCGCKSPGVPRNRGDGICRCFCHKRGLSRAKALCEMSLPSEGGDPMQAVQGTLFGGPTVSSMKSAAWVLVDGRGNACQSCVRRGTLLSRDEVEWHRQKVDT